MKIIGRIVSFVRAKAENDSRPPEGWEDQDTQPVCYERSDNDRVKMRECRVASAPGRMLAITAIEWQRKMGKAA